MRRFAEVITLSFGLLIVQQSLGQPGATSVAEVVKRSSDSVVQIVVSDSLGQQIALGSGFLISADGRIVTNFHVVKGGHSAIVKLTNGAFFPVEGVLAADADKDIAVVKVAGKNLPFLALGKVEDVHVGDHVVAIGSPLGLEGTVSDGIVSALREDGPSRSWIQTTAPVSHGNSGGPLLDLKTNVVGVVTWGVNLQLGQNLNFAAPSGEVKALLSEIHGPTPLDSVRDVAAKPTASDRAPSTLSGSIWTSITSGRDYQVRRDGDHIYTEWVNLPNQLKGTSAFQRSEFTREADGRWRGQAHIYLPCQYQSKWPAQTVTKWCRLDRLIEIDMISDTRIEGLGFTWQKFDCQKCEPGETVQKPFVWIPKD
jgi:hypothetical protein